MSAISVNLFHFTESPDPCLYRFAFKKTIMLSESNKTVHIAILYGTIVQKNLIVGKYNGDRSKRFQRVGTGSKDI